MMENGTYSAKVNGFHGPFTATVTVDNDVIENIDLEGLTPYTVGESAAKEMAKKIIKANSVDVDAITTASYSSSSAKLAVSKALKVAEGEITAEEAMDTKNDKLSLKLPTYQSPVSEKFYEDKFDDEYDMIIAGSGVSGLAAAVIAAQKGLSVMIYEKAGMSGGSSKYSEGEVQAADTKPQKDFSKYIDDSVDKHIKEMLQVGENSVEEDLVRDYAEDAPKIIEWLSSLGIEWTGVFGHKGLPYEDPEIFAERIHYYKHGGVAGGGIVLTNLLLKTALDAGAQITYDSPVISLIQKDPENSEVVGVVTESQGKRSFHRAKKGVLLATGGIDHNLSLSKRFNLQNYRDLLNHKVTTAKTDTGDGVILGGNIGGALTGFGGVVDSNTRIPQARDTQPTVPAIYVNGFGQRYVNEEMGYGYISYENYLQEDLTKKNNWAIFDESLLGMHGTWKDKAALERDMQKGDVVSASTVQELAEKTGLPKERLVATVANWNKDAKEGRDSEYGRKLAVQPIQSPFYAYKMTDSNYGAIGGLQVNVNQEVLDNNGNVIKGLYAAGMAAGGVIGRIYFASGLALGTGLHQGRKAAQVIADK